MLASRLTSTSYDRPYRPKPIALANRLAAPLAPLVTPRLLDERALLASASRATGSRQPGRAGSGEHPVLRPLRVLLRSLREEARLHPTGLLMVRQNLVRLLANRLRLDRAFASQPQSIARPSPPPIFIVGLQRTGTTLLHRLLAQDEGLRVLLSWEAINPAPLPSPGRLSWIHRTLTTAAASGKRRPRPGELSTAGIDRRLRAAELAQRALTYLAPDFFAIHPVEAREPEEDCLLLDYTFLSTVFEAVLRVPSFSAWLEQQPQRDAYRYYAKILAYLQWQRPAGTRWLLKTPHHMEQLDSLLHTFPRARVIQPHRDPRRVLASFCSMVAHGRGVFSDAVDPREVGAHWTAKQKRMVQRCLEVRSGGAERSFIDVAYAALVGDPLGEIRRIYRLLDRPLTARTEQRMRAWLAANPQHKHGRHRYRLEDFGLASDRVSRDFAAYRERFSIPSE